MSLDLRVLGAGLLAGCLICDERLDDFDDLLLFAARKSRDGVE